MENSKPNINLRPPFRGPVTLTGHQAICLLQLLFETTNYLKWATWPSYLCG